MAYPPPQNPGSADGQVQGYDKASQQSVYTRDTGLIVLPVAGPDGTPPRIIKTHAAIGYRRIPFDYAKRGTPPMFPQLAPNPIALYVPPSTSSLTNGGSGTSTLTSGGSSPTGNNPGAGGSGGTIINNPVGTTQATPQVVYGTPSGDIALGSTLMMDVPSVGGSQNFYMYKTAGEYVYVQYGPQILGDKSNGSATTTNYGPRGDFSAYQTGYLPFIPQYVNSLIYLQIKSSDDYYSNNGASVLSTTPLPPSSGSSAVDSVLSTSTPSQVNWIYPTPALPSGTGASSSINLANGDAIYYDTTIGPTFFSPSMIG